MRELLLLQLLALKEDMMETALEMKWGVHLPPLIYRIWLCVAKRVAIKVLLNNPDFQVCTPATADH